MSEVEEHYDVAAEMGVLSALCVVPKLWAPSLNAGLRAEVFYVPAHRKLFEVMQGLQRCGVEVNIVSLIDRLRDESLLDRVGGVKGVNTIIRAVDAPASVLHWVEILLRKWRMRQLVKQCESILTEVRERPLEVQKVLADSVRRLSDLGQLNRSLSQRDIVSQAVQLFEDELSGAWMDGNCIRTGLTDFDVPFGMLRTSLEDYLVLLMAPPSCGKSSLARQIVRVNCEDGKRCAVFLRETTAKRFYLQMAANWSGFNLRYANRPPDPNLNHGLDLSRWEDARDLTKKRLKLIEQEWVENRLWVFDNDRTISDIESRCRFLARESGDINLAVVDYLQIVRPDNEALPREQQIADISMRCKDLGKELDCSLLGLTQMNRESRKGVPRVHVSSNDKGEKVREEYVQFPEPQLTDLRESGALEQDADAVLSLFQPSFDYNGDLQKKSWQTLLVEIFALKRRNGPVGKKRFLFKKNVTRFEDLPNVSADGTYKKREEYKDKK